MKKTKSSLRAGIFLDLNNFSKEIQKKCQNCIIDYLKLKEKMALDYPLKRAYAFIGVSNPIKTSNAKFG